MLYEVRGWGATIWSSARHSAQCRGALHWWLDAWRVVVAAFIPMTTEDSLENFDSLCGSHGIAASQDAGPSTHIAIIAVSCLD